MVLKDWTKIVISTYYGVDWPLRGRDNVHEFLREHFGDNDIHQAYDERRWIIVRGQGEHGLDRIYFKDEKDAVWFNLTWRLK